MNCTNTTSLRSLLGDRTQSCRTRRTYLAISARRLASPASSGTSLKFSASADVPGLSSP
ncbi:hypothetical protein Mapa_000988 [Marchantia paleacea]|nr:hypothetical protein Mapa_000988 [Marchantia paleacea]